MSTTSKPVVRAVGLTKVFRDFWGRPKARAVNDIDFEIHEGEVVGLLGLLPAWTTSYPHLQIP